MNSVDFPVLLLISFYITYKVVVMLACFPVILAITVYELMFSGKARVGYSDENTWRVNDSNKSLE